MTVPPVPLVLLSSQLQRHLVVAVARHCKLLRADGIAPPAELLALLDMLAASSGQEGSHSPGSVQVPDAELVNYKIAGQRLGVSERTVRRMVSAGTLATVRIGRRRLVPAAALRLIAEAVR